MKGLLQKPIFQRMIGAICAGAVIYGTSGDWKAAVTTAISFGVYGAAHTTTEKTSSNTP